MYDSIVLPLYVGVTPPMHTLSVSFALLMHCETVGSMPDDIPTVVVDVDETGYVPEPKGMKARVLEAACVYACVSKFLVRVGVGGGVRG